MRKPIIVSFFLVKLKSAILIYALVISLLSFLFVLGILQFFLVSNQEKLAIIKAEYHEDLLLSGIEFLRAYDQSLSDTSFSVDLFQNERSQLILTKKEFGVFNILIAEYPAGKDTLRKIVQPGCYDFENKTALYLCNSIYELKLGGNALLEGDVYLPERGISRANVSGKSYTRDSLVYGTALKTPGILPKLAQRIIKYSPEYLKKEITRFQIFTISDFYPKTRSFAEKTLVIQCPAGNPDFSDTLNGNFILYSSDSLIIHKNASLTNVLVCAPKIIVEEGFTGNGQFIASDSLMIEKEAKLTFPTVLLLNSKNEKAQPRLFLDENVLVQGLIILNYENKENHYSTAIPLLWIGDQCKITGSVYSTHAVYHRGEIWGSLYCPQLTDLSQGLNENILLDGQISKRKQPNVMPDFQLFDKPLKSRVIQWLP